MPTKQLTVSQYAELRQVSVTYVNRLLRDADLLEDTGNKLVRQHSKKVTQSRYLTKRKALVGVIDWLWIGHQRVLTVDLPSIGAVECAVCHYAFNIEDEAHLINNMYYTCSNHIHHRPTMKC
jgi:hypothetical protein